MPRDALDESLDKLIKMAGEVVKVAREVGLGQGAIVSALSVYHAAIDSRTEDFRARDENFREILEGTMSNNRENAALVVDVIRSYEENLCRGGFKADDLREMSKTQPVAAAALAGTKRGREQQQQMGLEDSSEDDV